MRLQWVILGWYLAMSLVTAGAYWFDKRSARSGGWRTRERTLHALAWAGGWPGGLAAARIFRHKRRKIGFMLWLWGAALAHGGFWIWRWFGG